MGNWLCDLGWTVLPPPEWHVVNSCVFLYRPLVIGYRLSFYAATFEDGEAL